MTDDHERASELGEVKCLFRHRPLARVTGCCESCDGVQGPEGRKE